MPKYSVKKPFTILVAVILVLVLGFVSLTGIQTDLLPAMNLPYLMVITTYPGASPEQVEADVTKPLENALSTLNGVKNVTSQSNENYSLLFLEYQDDTDMDSAMVKASTAVNQLGDALPDMASTPTLMEISPDMMATQYIAVDYDGMDIYELSDYVSENVLPQLERVDGVASVSTTGLVEKSVQITLDQEKIDALNAKIRAAIDGKFTDGETQIADGLAQVLLIAVLAFDDLFPVPLIHIDGVEVVHLLVAADGVHVGEQALAGLEVIALQRQALPLGQGVHHLTGGAHIGDIKGNRALHAVEVVVQTGILLHEQRSGNPAQIQRLPQIHLKIALDELDSPLHLIGGQRRFVAGRDRQFAHA